MSFWGGEYNGKCRLIARRYIRDGLMLDEGSVYAHMIGGKWRCVADYENIDLYNYFIDSCSYNCEAVTRTAEEYESCMNSCDEEIRLAARGSISFDPNTLEVLESTIPTTCPVEENEELVTRPEKVVEKFRKYGFEAQEAGWIHEHEFVRDYLGTYEPEEEYPAICYIHVKKGKLPDLMKLIR